MKRREERQLRRFRRWLRFVDWVVASKWRDRIFTWTLEAVIAGCIGINLLFAEQGTGLWQFNLFSALFIVGASAWRHGIRVGKNAVHEAFEQFTHSLPASISFEQNDETGEKTAFVTKGNGDIVTVPIPDHIDNAHDAARYIMETVIEDATDD